jgi:hypothetical protein
MTLPLYYQLVFALVQHHKWSGEYIDNLYPFERDLYTEMLQNYLKKQEEHQLSSA